MGVFPARSAATNGFEVPHEALPYIAMHRTHLRGDLGQLYVSDVRSDFEALQPWLPGSARSTLDIGCGMAGIDVLLWRHYGSPDIHLLDGTGLTDVRILFHATMSPYNSMPVARRLLEQNGLEPGRIMEWPPQADAPVPPCDLVVSLLSWGFHYPVTTYLPLVERCLRPGGRLILDVRKNQGGLETLDRSGLQRVGIVSTTVKADRVCYERRAGT